MFKELSKSSRSCYSIYLRTKKKGKIISVKYSCYSEKNLEYHILSRADYYREYTKSTGCDSYDIFGISIFSWAAV
ncbi:hypothetical protein CJF31_00011309 [Rutstroemia sp. NJR-2017a BVV2]|nr:hypothetical protein CJF31_00011309 [Rutstroemia sp. NJR-2017a BVV2]